MRHGSEFASDRSQQLGGLRAQLQSRPALVALTVGTGLALVLARRLVIASRALGSAAARLGAGNGAKRPTAREFARLPSWLIRTGQRMESTRASEQQAQQAHREMMSWASHDLRSPLATIRAVSEALEDGIVDDPQVLARYHRALRVEADRLSALIDDMFELSRLQSGVMALELEPASLAELVSEALAASDPVAAARGVRLHAREPPPAQLRVSPPEFRRALHNLMQNAIRETPAQGTVSVEAGVEGEQAWVAVSDSCGGIPEEELPRLFEPGFRGRRARRSAPGRAGLGLAIAKGLVEAHRGEISVSNSPVGCRFVIRLPLGV